MNKLVEKKIISLLKANFMLSKELLSLSVSFCLVDAVGSLQIILPMPNLERPYQSDKGSEAVLRCLQYKQCAGPQKVSKFRF